MIGENVKRLAGLHLVSNVELAEFVGLSRQAMQNIVSGKSQPSVKTLERLARAFGIGLDDLLADPKRCLHAAVEVLDAAPIYLHACGLWEGSGLDSGKAPRALVAVAREDLEDLQRRAKVVGAERFKQAEEKAGLAPKVRKPRPRVPRSLQGAGKPHKS